MHLLRSEIPEFIHLPATGKGAWICSFGNCTRPAAYLLVTIKSIRGACETCATRYAKRNEMVIPDELED